MAKAKKAVKKAAKKSGGDRVERHKKIFSLLLRKNGCTMADLVEIGHNQPAKAALRIAETHGLKTSSKKEEGDVTHYFATGTPTDPVRKPRAAKKGAKNGAKNGAKKAVKAAAKKPAKKAAKKKARKAPAAVEASAAA